MSSNSYLSRRVAMPCPLLHCLLPLPFSILPSSLSLLASQRELPSELILPLQCHQSQAFGGSRLFPSRSLISSPQLHELSLILVFLPPISCRTLYSPAALNRPPDPARGLLFLLLSYHLLDPSSSSSSSSPSLISSNPHTPLIPYHRPTPRSFHCPLRFLPPLISNPLIDLI